MRLYAMKGGRWAGTQADAKTIDTEFAQVEVSTDKPGLLHFLNKNAVEPVEIWPKEPEPDTSDIPIASREWFESASLTITDEAFDKFPLARQLHFAALAMENARACLKGEAA